MFVYVYVCVWMYEYMNVCGGVFGWVVARVVVGGSVGTYMGR